MQTHDLRKDFDDTPLRIRQNGPHRSHLSRPRHREDIDGLRAVAVLPVIAFHAFPGWVQGGFIGVDIFFVISGFLISTIIIENLHRGSFSFIEFYTRRVKRIFPALIAMLAATYAFGWLALAATEYRQFAKHVAGAAGFVANFVFWHEAGYFDNSAETKPLLHLWSLGVEEQFYIVWPLIVWLMWRRGRSLLRVALPLALGSFALNLMQVRTDIVAAFYSPLTRFWELMAGSLLAWFTFFKTVDNPVVATPRVTWPKVLDWFSVLGVCLLVVGFWSISQQAVFPGLWALVPVLGTVLVIAAGPTAAVNRTLLSNPLASKIGRVSYPLYLWHWPLLSFARIAESGKPPVGVRLALIAGAFLLAWATYAWVEGPIRFRSRRNTPVVALYLSMAVIGVVGFTTYRYDGLQFRKNAHFMGSSGDIGHLAFHRYVAEHFYTCTPQSVADEADKWEGFVRCNQSKPGTDIDVALVGDSHAEHLFIGLADALSSRNVVFYTRGNPPFVDTPDFRRIWDTVLLNKSIKKVVYTMSWGWRGAQLPEGTFEDELRKSIDALTSAGKQVILTEDVPMFPFPPEKCLVRPLFTFVTRNCAIAAEIARSQTDVYLSSVEIAASRGAGVKFLRTHQYFCDNRTCSMTKDGAILYRDDNHLNIEGSRYLGRHLVEDNKGCFDDNHTGSPAPC